VGAGAIGDYAAAEQNLAEAGDPRAATMPARLKAAQREQSPEGQPGAGTARELGLTAKLLPETPCKTLGAGEASIECGNRW
jgi:hypothetical protein